MLLKRRRWASSEAEIRPGERRSHEGAEGQKLYDGSLALPAENATVLFC
jgi:hypothetical protein